MQNKTLNNRTIAVLASFICAVHTSLYSVAVSAKNADGSVHAAIQALIRHLIERKLMDRTLDRMTEVKVNRVKVMKGKKKKKKDPKAFEPLDKTGIKEVKYNMQTFYCKNTNNNWKYIGPFPEERKALFFNSHINPRNKGIVFLHVFVCIH